jgi:tetratricopeptide (TPR) repeat protein
MTRHELKEQDEITSSLQRVTETVYARKKQLVIAGVAIVVLIVVVSVWRVYAANRNAAAQTQLSHAINAFNDPNIKSDKERFDKTLSEAQKTRDSYGSSPAGAIAQYYMGLSYEGLGDTAKADENLQQVIQHGDESVAGVARFALAGIYKKHGDAAKAEELYKQLYEKGGYSRSAAAYELAKLNEANNKMDEAKNYYQKIVSEFPDSPFRQDAEQALKRLGGA